MAFDLPLSSIRVRKKQLLFALFSFVFLTLAISSCDRSGVCVGSGGSVLRSPVCYENWDKSECQEYDEQEINDADWSFHSGDSCANRGFTQRCAENTFREPGSC